MSFFKIFRIVKNKLVDLYRSLRSPIDPIELKRQRRRAQAARRRKNWKRNRAIRARLAALDAAPDAATPAAITPAIHKVPPPPAIILPQSQQPTPSPIKAVVGWVKHLPVDHQPVPSAIKEEVEWMEFPAVGEEYEVPIIDIKIGEVDNEPDEPEIGKDWDWMIILQEMRTRIENAKETHGNSLPTNYYPYVCIECPSDFSQILDFTRHLEEDHQFHVSPSQRKELQGYKCHTCKRAWGSLSGRNLHFKYKDNDCNKTDFDKLLLYQ